MGVIDADEAASRLLAATGIASADVPPRRLGADWFREQPAWLAASMAADRLVCDAALSPTDALMTAAELLEEDLDPEARELVCVGFVEAMVCSASHGDGSDGARLIDVSPVAVWRTWHQKRERLEALSEQRTARLTAPRALSSNDEAVAMVGRCTTYRAESGRYVVLADLISADRPSPWPLRHPVLVGLLFGAFMLVMLVLSLSRSL